MPLHAATIFLSAFLLFLVQPILAKQILPWFGGAAIVWTLCMVFFQLVLLLGYAYAHWLTSRASRRRQAWVHIALLVAGLAFLPISAGRVWKPAGDDNPVRGSCCCSSPPSAALLPAVVHQPAGAGVVRARLSGLEPVPAVRALQLRLDAGAVGYPFLFEPWFTNPQQSNYWSVGFALFVRCCAGSRGRTRACRRSPRPTPQADGRPGAAPRWTDIAPVARALGHGLGRRCSGLQPPHAEHLLDPAAVGDPARGLPPHVHPLLRGAQLGTCATPTSRAWCGSSA
jgi:hypothetical protein